mgnify:FL=1
MILIKTNKDTLLKPLQIVTGVVERRHTLPILSNVLIQQKEKKLSFLATDLEIQIETFKEINQSKVKEFTLTVSAKKFQDILRTLPTDSEVTLNRQDNRLQVNAGNSSFNLQILPPEDFPKISEDSEPINVITVQQKELKNLF